MNCIFYNCSKNLSIKSSNIGGVPMESLSELRKPFKGKPLIKKKLIWVSPLIY